MALQDIQQAATKRWAIEMATMINLQLDANSVPYMSGDFLGYGNREKRAQEKMVNDLRVRKINQQLAAAMPRAQRKGDPEPDNLPLWARKNPIPPSDLTPVTNPVEKKESTELELECLR